GPAPFGYKKEGVGESRKLIIDDPQANVVRFVYDAYLRNTPDYIVLRDIRQMGFHLRGKSAIKSILMNPIYSAQQYVRTYKELPGGTFPGNWPAIINLVTWTRVQDKLNYKPRARVTVVEELPLRGVLRCHCGKLLTGAPSSNKAGNYFYYYKCQHSKHNNISAIKAHEQLRYSLGYMSLPEKIISAVRDHSIDLIEQREKENRKLFDAKRREYDNCEKQLKSIEEKWINEQINFETYNRWHNDLTQKRNLLKVETERLNKTQDEVNLILGNNLDKLSDMESLYKSSTTLQKQELVRQVFDNNLYYENKVYRTPYIMPVFSHNIQILKDKRLLIVDNINEKGAEAPFKWR
ncbi:MAG TPA: hypothetical protein VK588_01510, partial [Chitinophagaceae bacterium]|nr:hypothetical protein [Chitinophagaceae bacterium]